MDNEFQENGVSRQPPKESTNHLKLEIHKTHDIEGRHGESLVIHAVTKTSALSEIDKQTIAEGMARINPALNAQVILEHLNGDNYQLYYLSDSGEGLVSYATVFPDHDNPKSAYLNKIQTSDKHRRKGYAGTILRQIQADFDKIWLVNNIGEAGLKEGMGQFYLNQGFVSDDGTKYTWHNER